MPRGSPSRTARVAPDEIDYVNAHASATPIGDLAEARAIAAALGEAAATVPVSGTKALYGHPLGASGAIEAASAPSRSAMVGPRRRSTSNSRTDEIASLLPGLLRSGLPGTYRRVLSTSFGFGGLNAALVLGAAEGAGA